MADVNLEELVVEDQHRRPSARWPWAKVIVGAVLLTLLGSIGWQAWLRYRPRAEVDVVQVVAKTGTVDARGASFEAAGWIEPDPFPDYVSTLIEGWVTELPIVEGDSVEKGQLIARLYDEDYRLALDQVKADRDVLEAEGKYLEKKLAIDKRLHEEGALDLLVLEKTTAEHARIKVELRRAGLRITLARRNLDRCRITAPLSGVVLRRFVSLGQHLRPASHSVHLVSLYHPERLQVRVDVNLADVQKASVGTECELRVESVPAKVFRGIVSRVVHEADNQKNTVQFKVRIQEPDAALKPEMLGRVRFLGSKTAEPSETVRRFIPEKAVVRSGADAFVYVARGAWPRTVAERVQVKTGSAAEGGLIEVQEGLDLSAKVIVTGVGELVDGEPIRVRGGS